MNVLLVSVLVQMGGLVQILCRVYVMPCIDRANVSTLLARWCPNQLVVVVLCPFLCQWDGECLVRLVLCLDPLILTSFVLMAMDSLMGEMTSMNVHRILTFVVTMELVKI